LDFDRRSLQKISLEQIQKNLHKQVFLMDSQSTTDGSDLLPENR